MERMMLKLKLYRIIFNADTPAGRRFDLALIFVIILSVIAVILESVPTLLGSSKIPASFVQPLAHRPLYI